jgi:putative ABC transport system permease protein
MKFWRTLLSRTNWEQNLTEELRDHIERQTAANVAAGMTREEARRHAKAQFGTFDGVKEDCREERRGFWAETIWADARFGFRMLRKTPGFTLVAVLTLALGIGASTAVFSVVNAILLKPLPYPHSERIMLPWRIPAAGMNLGFSEFPWGRVDSEFLFRESKAFESLGAFKTDSFNLTGSGDPQRLDGLRASAGFFPSLGVSPVLGRTFTAEEDQAGRDHEVVLGFGVWRNMFGGDTAVLGRVIELNGEPYTVIGVMPSGFVYPRAVEMPPSFNMPRETQLWVPLALAPGPLIPAEPWELAVIGRLKPGVTIEQAQAEMNVIAKGLDAQYPRAKGFFESRVTPLSRQVAGDTRRPLLFILGAVGVVLLIACSNVASLLLARTLGRSREFILRAALGAGPARLVRQLLTESVLLAVIGGAAGLLLASAGIYFVKMLGPSSISRLREATLDVRVFSFTLAVVFITGILFGLAPAIGATRQNLVEALKEGGQRTRGGNASARLRRVFLVSEMALALVLVVAAGLLTQTFFRLLAVDPGFRAAHALTFELTLPAAKYTDQEHIVALYQRALERLRSLPGVNSAGIVAAVPLGGATESTGIRFSDSPTEVRKKDPYASYTMTSPGYFDAAGTPILRGRDFLESDSAHSMPVTVINNAMAKKFWPGEDPIGKHVAPGSPLYPIETIVGVVADVKHISLRDEPSPEMYVPYTQKVWPSLLTMDVVLRTSVDPASMTSSVREAIHSVDPDLPLAKVATLDNLVDDSMTPQRFSVLLLGSFGAIALVLASIGMYGVISYSVMQRTQEIGIRMALGAERRSVLGMVLSEGARLGGIGIAIGLVAALAVTRLMAGFLYGVGATDPLTFAGVSLLLLGVALFACYIPARRAMRVDPMIALRYE